MTSTLSRETIPKYVLNFFLWGLSIFPVAESTWIRDFSAPTDLVANDLSRVVFLVHFKVEGECDAKSIGGGRSELGGVAICLLRKNINFKDDHKTILCYVTE